MRLNSLDDKGCLIKLQGLGTKLFKENGFFTYSHIDQILDVFVDKRCGATDIKLGILSVGQTFKTGQVYPTLIHTFIELGFTYVVIKDMLLNPFIVLFPFVNDLFKRMYFYISASVDPGHGTPTA